MIANEPQIVATARYSIGQTCKLLGIHRDTLRRYTDRQKVIKCGYRTIGNRKVKFYLGSEILRFWKRQA